jgi:hypothetical protein
LAGGQAAALFFDILQQGKRKGSRVKSVKWGQGAQWRLGPESRAGRPLTIKVNYTEWWETNA